MHAKIIIDSNSRFLDRSFTYKVPDDLCSKITTGVRVIVPFGKGNKTVIGFVYELCENIKTTYTLKEIIEIIDDRKLISDELMDLAFFMSKRYLSPINDALKQVMPPTSIKDINIFYENISNEGGEFLEYLSKKRNISEIKEKFPDYKLSLIHI